ncbi:ribonuclease P protein component [Candidatus Saccharibacteria bacterium CG_4_10_14_0_2_um_filter_52_9]|nr:MAG: ribonuclease P protein component [Candidatus Saccharibacteria bacterium CG_4_10_14_0_2_um_filter_52_9]
MIGQQHRFHGYGSLRGVYQRGSNVRGQLISLKFAQRDPKRPYRVAVVVSRKVSKSAVVRNRIRRRVYEQVRRTDISIPPGTDLVFTAFSEQIATMEEPKLRESITKLLNDALMH